MRFRVSSRIAFSSMGARVGVATPGGGVTTGGGVIGVVGVGVDAVYLFTGVPPGGSCGAPKLAAAPVES